MEMNFSFRRVLIFVGLVGVFAWWGGFSPPSVVDDSSLSLRRVGRAWRYCVLLFLSGAVCVSVIDHYVGTMDRSNIRLAYIILGCLLMGSGVLWLRGLRVGVASSREGEVMAAPDRSRNEVGGGIDGGGYGGVFGPC